jgi:small subunit ribosomal protein S3
MGRKINPIAIRMGINKTWGSTWYVNKNKYPEVLEQDLKLRKIVTKALRDAGIDKIKIYRTIKKIDIEVYVARPGVAIGRGGEGIDKLQKELSRMIQQDVEVKIKEVVKADISARIIARNIADGIERRVPPKLLIISSKEKAMMAGAEGIKIQVSGRINNASQARAIKMGEGSVPAQTLRADIDYAEETAQTLDAGLMGVKVWVYKGDKIGVEEEE